MATFRKRNDKWNARVTFHDYQGNRHENSKTFKTKKEARAWAYEKENEVTHDQNVLNNNVSLVDYYFKWYKTFKKPFVRSATQTRFIATGTFLKKYWKNTKLQSINYIDYQEFINEISSKYAKTTVQKVHRQTRSAVKKAIQMHVIHNDFTDGVQLGGKAGKPESMKYLEIGQMNKLIAYCSDFNSIQDISKLMIYTALLTGMRYEEIIGLTWDDINFKSKTISINKSYNQIKKEFQPTKTSTSIREIDISDVLVTKLLNLKLFQNKYLVTHGLKNTNNFVFLSRLNNIISSGSINKSLKYYCNKLDIKQITFHALRHTHASFLLSKGINIQYISKRLGHANTTITMEVYAHLLQEKKTKEAKLTTNLFNNII